MSKNYSTGEMAKKLGVGVRTLQRWDKDGKLVANRHSSNRRFYTHEQFLKASKMERYIKCGQGLDAVKDKVVLITGGSGSLGRSLARRIASVAKKVIIFSRGELKQAEMSQEFSEFDNIRYLIGDIRDFERVRVALKNVDICINAAALKRIEVNHYNVQEAVKTNVTGTLNVANACIENSVSLCLFVSTDKACNPCSTYGALKMTSERLWSDANNYSNKNSIFSSIRYGNILGSNGSIIHLVQKFKEDGVVKLTDKDMSRFWMTLDKSVDLVLYALNNMIGGEIFVPKTKASTLLKFAEVFAPGVPIEYIGVRGIEKIHEELIAQFEVPFTVDCGNGYYKILPPFASVKNVGWDSEYPDYKTIKELKYNSKDAEQYSEEELRGLGENL